MKNVVSRNVNYMSRVHDATEKQMKLQTQQQQQERQNNNPIANERKQQQQQKSLRIIF